MDGYIRQKPDTDWWMTQIWRGIEYRRVNAYESDWPVRRKYYRSQWGTGVMPKNIFYMMMRTVVPRIYFRNPSVSVTPGGPGLKNMLFAQLQQRIDNKLMRQMGFKREMKRVVSNAFQFGTGVGKLGFGSQYSPAPEFGTTGEPIKSSGERLEYRDKVFQNMPWFASTSPGDFIVPDQLRVFEDARWTATWFRRPVEDVKADPRFKNTNHLVPSSVTADSRSHRLPTSPRYGHSAESDDHTDLIEIHDKKLNKVIVLSPYGSGAAKELFFGPDEFLDNGSFPTYPLVFNEDDEIFWGLPDSKVLEPYQMELNETNTQIMKHRRMSLVKMAVEKGAIDEDEKVKLMSEDHQGIVMVNSIKGFDKFQASDIPQNLMLHMQSLSAEIREIMGFGRNQFGEFNSRSGDTTATEATIVNAATEIRVDERRDMVADMIVDVFEGVHSIIHQHWTTNEVVDVVGPGGVPVWVEFSGDMLRNGRYTIKVDPDSSLPLTKDLREQKALGLYQILKTNPLIDPEKLTQYLLSEVQGVQFDDMMKTLPQVQGQGNPNQPVGVEQFGSMISQSLSAARDNPDSINRPQLVADNTGE